MGTTSIKRASIKKRGEQFTSRTVTKIWQEVSLQDNPYLAEDCRCYGYDILELAAKRSFVDVSFLLLSGDLPTVEQSELLESLMVSFINPGPRHPATRAAMNAGVGRTFNTHILPIGLSVMGGSHLGGDEVTAAMRFLRAQGKKDPSQVLEELLRDEEQPKEGDWHIAPGFGSRFGGVEPMPQKIAALLSELPASGKTIAWGNEFAALLLAHGMGWLSTGLSAAVFCDLGLLPRVGAGLFQLMSAPGILAHGLELANKSRTAMPFLDEQHYVIADEARKK